MLKKNQIHTAEITGYTAQGLGVCRIDGQVVFVHGGIHGEKLRVRIVKVLKQEAYGIIEELLEPSPSRIKPDCPYNKACGGCATRHMDYAEELRFKAARVRDALNRLGGQTLEEVPILGAECTENYRNKAIFPVAEVDGVAEIGFYRARSHDLIPVECCRIQSPVADAAREAVLTWLRQYRIPVYDEVAHKGLVRHLYVRNAEATGQVLVCLVVCGNSVPRENELVQSLRKAVPGLASVVLNENTQRGNVILADRFRTLWGEDFIEDVLCGIRFRLSPRSFYQVNRKQAQRLYEMAITRAGLTGGETVLDLYCGTGTITLCLAKACKQAIGVEIIPAAIEDAGKNAQENGIENARFFCADAGQAALQLAREGIRPDVIVVDPPRKGLTGDVIEAMGQMHPKRIVYVSCDPGTLARDVKLLSEKGYILQTADAVDLFPRCAHVETVCLLTLDTEDVQKMLCLDQHRRNNKGKGRGSMTHSMKLHSAPFSMIKSGKKTIELRLWDEKRRQMQVGDRMVFTNTATGEELTAAILALHRFSTFEELYRALPLLSCGYTPENVDAAAPADMDAYYSPEKQRKYGVVGIELSLLA